MAKCFLKKKVSKFNNIFLRGKKYCDRILHFYFHFSHFGEISHPKEMLDSMVRNHSWVWLMQNSIQNFYITCGKGF
jgi:hypothetical protein